VVITAKWVLVLVAVILIVLAAFAVKISGVDLFELGIAAFFASYLVPCVASTRTAPAISP
jgi:hypothetical protein